jgi:hypothetical protein
MFQWLTVWPGGGAFVSGSQSTPIPSREPWGPGDSSLQSLAAQELRRALPPVLAVRPSVIRAIEDGRATAERPRCLVVPS